MSLIDVTLRAQIQQTKNLINTAGRTIRLNRPSALVDDGAGGKKRVGTAVTSLPARTRYFGGLTSEGRGATTRPDQWFITSLGEKYKLYFVLIGMPDDDIQVDDYFFLNNQRYDVLFKHGDVDQYQAKFTVGLQR